MGKTAQPEYAPPQTAEMINRQNDSDGLRLLIAQRRLYSRAKRWVAIRWFGMLVIGLAAPVVSVIWPKLAVVAGAVAGLWIFLGRTSLLAAQSAITAKAAATQEQFDFHVFGMPSIIERSTAPSLEEIAAIAGAEQELLTVAGDQKLLDWYPFDLKDSGVVAVAISQRSNAAYSGGLMRATATTWVLILAFWLAFLVIISLVAKLSLLSFLAGIVLPVLPAFLDVVQYVMSIRKAAHERSDLARSIEHRLHESSEPIDGNDLLVWQSRLYELRRSAPEVPDLIYKIKRAKSERAMKVAASLLGRRVRRSKN